MPDNKYNFNQKYYLLIIICIVINSVGLLLPITRNDDPLLYAIIAKNILLNHNWAYLEYPLHTAWLDKPHLPFWIIALSYKIFGINYFAYTVSGFMFYLLGGAYTYKLAKLLTNINTALLATLIYFSICRLQLSATLDIRAEVYLIGMIMPASYYWFKFFYLSKNIFNKNLLLAAIFTAASIMTKGVFTLITIASGSFGLICYNVKTINRMQITVNLIKILLLLSLIGVFIVPELIALYLQFDSQKIVTHTTILDSGIKWFLWDSQIGRFFNTGPITRTTIIPLHYLFFVHTFVWAFLPWTLVAILAIWYGFKKYIFKETIWYLMFSVFITFTLFSVSKFQLDYYINILFPFIAIICGIYLNELQYINWKLNILYFQYYLLIFLMLLGLTVTIILLIPNYYILIILSIIFCGLITYLIKNKFSYLGLIVNTVLVANFLFLCILAVYFFSIIANDTDYNLVKFFKSRPKLDVISYEYNSLVFEFYLWQQYIKVDDLKTLKVIKKPFFLVIQQSNLSKIKINNSNIEIVQNVKKIDFKHKILNTLHINSQEMTTNNVVILKIN